jgi:hypothetical protein
MAGPDDRKTNNDEPSGEYAAFESLLRHVVSVPKKELERREEYYRQEKGSTSTAGHKQPFLSTGRSVKK